jgi:hypothetical protein
VGDGFVGGVGLDIRSIVAVASSVGGKVGILSVVAGMVFSGGRLGACVGVVLLQAVMKRRKTMIGIDRFCKLLIGTPYLISLLRDCFKYTTLCRRF